LKIYRGSRLTVEIPLTIFTKEGWKPKNLTGLSPTASIYKPDGSFDTFPLTVVDAVGGLTYWEAEPGYLDQFGTWKAQPEVEGSLYSPVTWVVSDVMQEGSYPSIIAAQIIDEARDYHVAFDDRGTPDKAMLRTLSRIERKLAQDISVVAENSLAVTQNYVNVAGMLENGIPVPEHLLVLQATISSGGYIHPLHMVSWADRLSEGVRRHPSAYITGQRLMLGNPSLHRAGGAGWSAVDGITVTYVPVPPPLTSLSQPISLPDQAHTALVTNLAWWLAVRYGMQRELRGLEDSARAAEESLIMSLADQGSTSTWMVRVTDLR
jgi:hypothetical protein